MKSLQRHARLRLAAGASARLRPPWNAMRDFLRGFTGLAGPGRPDTRPHDAASARRALEERARRRPTCC